MIRVLVFCTFLPCLIYAQSDTLVMRSIDSLIGRAREQNIKKDFTSAFATNAIAEQLALQTWGRESYGYGKACFNKARFYHNQRQYPEALNTYNEAREILLKTVGTLNADYAFCIHNLGVLSMDKGRYAEAEPLLLEARNIRAQVIGNQHPDYIRGLNNLALAYSELGQYEKAEQYQTENLNLCAAVFGTESPDYAINLNNLALNYMKMANYSKAEPLFLQAKAIRAKILGTDHPDYASSLNNLANLYFNQGLYEQSIPLCIEAKNIREKALGKSHPRYAWSVNNLAFIYSTIGDFEAAETLLLEALDIKAQSVGKVHQDYAMSLNNLGELYMKMNNSAKAEAFLQETILIREKTLGKAHPEYAIGLENLANLYRSTGDWAKAEPLLIEALQLGEQGLAKDHPDNITTRSNLANLYVQMGKPEQALPLFLECNAQLANVPGKAHPFYAMNLLSIANIHRDAHRFEEAKPLYTVASETLANALGSLHPEYAQCLDDFARMYWLSGNLSEAQKRYETSAIIHRNLLIRATRHLSESELALYTQKYYEQLHTSMSFVLDCPSFAGTAYDNMLFYKGFLQNAVSQNNAAVLKHPELKTNYDQLRGIHRRLAALYAHPLEMKPKIDTLETQANLLEKDLIRQMTGLGNALVQYDWVAVKNALKPGEAAVEIIHFTQVATQSEMYIALVLRPESEIPQIVSLCTGADLEKRVHLSDKNPRAMAVNKIYQQGKDNLWPLVWQPMLPYLKDIKKIYFSPSGGLHRVNMGALADPEQRTAADRFQLIQYYSTRQLAIPAPLLADTSRRLASLWGGIEYGKMPGTHQVVMRSHFPWSPLNWTGVEIKAAGLILEDAGYKVSFFQDSVATEDAFRQIGLHQPAPAVIHLATHGFFVPSVEPQAKTIRTPAMMRSGLVMAGANSQWGNGSDTGKEDGALTAYEISQMNLEGNTLVVLSACETGLGDLEGNEGVYGLQRAFKIAGAGYLLMSLWQVPDFHTQEFMTAFYAEWLEHHRTVTEAFQVAQQTMRQRYKDPFLWAGFILMQ